jgi:hypothetical protein
MEQDGVELNVSCIQEAPELSASKLRREIVDQTRHHLELEDLFAAAKRGGAVKSIRNGQ